MINNVINLFIKKEKEVEKKGLEKYFAIPEKVKIYIPSTKNVNEKMSHEEHEEYVKYVMSYFTRLFGGSSAEKILGSYESKEKGIVFENITIVYSFTNELTEEKEKAIETIAQWLKKELSQECILVEVEKTSKAYFVE